MRKKVILIVALLLGCLAGCQAAGKQKYGTELTQEQMEEISNAWFENYNYKFVWYGEHDGGVKYLGSENDYAFLVMFGGFDMEWKHVIADCEFKFGSQFHLFAYKDGSFHLLKDVYDAGDVSKDAVYMVFEAYTAHLQETFLVIHDLYYG